MWWSSTLSNLDAKSVSKSLPLSDNFSSIIPEYEYAYYSFKQSEERDKPIFYGVLNHKKENSQFFLMHNFKTVPFITVSKQKAKRFEGEPFY